MNRSSSPKSDTIIKIFFKLIFFVSISLIILPVSWAEEEKHEQEADWKYAKDVNEQDITWVSTLNQTMKWGDRVNIKDWALGNFTVELTDLMKDATNSRIIGTLMTVTGENKRSQVTMGSDESQTVAFEAPLYDDEMKISASIDGERTWSRELFEPNISVQVYLRGKPDINISYSIYNEDPASNTNLNTTDTLESNKLFYIQVSIENKGNATLKDALLDVNLTNFTTQEQTAVQREGVSFKYTGSSVIYDLNDLKVGDKRVLNLSVISPVSPVNKTFIIPMKLTGSDNKNVHYTFRIEKQLIIKPFIDVKKQVALYVNYSGADVLYVNELFRTLLTMKNNGNQDVMINLTDSVPDSFAYQTKENESLNWSVIIPPKSSRTISYSIKPIKYIETVLIPKATAKFELEGKIYSVESNDIEVKIKGSDVSLTKDVKINQQDNGIINATVIVGARNLGDQRVSLKIMDILPDNASLTNGTTSQENIFLEKNELFSYSYEISIPSGEEIILPAAKGYYIDFRTYLEKDNSNKEDIWRKIESNQPVIGPRQPTPAIAPENVDPKQKNISLSNDENITLPALAEKEERKTKLGIIKNFILMFIGSITGKQGIEESQAASLMEIQPVIKRIEETHSSFTWTVGWERQEDANASSGTWKVSGTPGSKVAVSFTGTGVALLYSAGQDGGTASIEVDGKAYPDIDMYSSIPYSKINMTIASGLENTQHTLSITVSGKKNPAASSSLIVVDAVEVTRS